MNYEGTKCYKDIVKKINIKTDMLEGCKNRMCITDDRDELFKLFAHLNLYAVDLYRLNNERLYISEYGEKNKI